MHNLTDPQIAGSVQYSTVRQSMLSQALRYCDSKTCVILIVVLDRQYLSFPNHRYHIVFEVLYVHDAVLEMLAKATAMSRIRG